MSRAAIFAGFMLFLLTALTAADQNAQLPESFIVGGEDARLGQFPHMVSIRFFDQLSHGCGGGILNTRWVLTAAHCIMSGHERLIVAGAIRLTDEGTRYEIVQSVPHPRYIVTTSNWHDIGMVRVGRDIQYNRFVSPIPINRRRVLSSIPAQLSGWGAFTQGPPWTSKEHLQYKNTTIMTNTECIWRTALAGFFEPEYRPVIYSGHICTLAERGIGGCFGDSGSPLIARGEVVAVVSFGLSCARGAPDILVRTSSYIGWIESFTGRL